MSKEYATPLILDLKKSSIVNVYQIAVHLLAVFAVLYASISAWLMLVLVVFISLHFFYQKTTSNKFSKIVWLSDNQWNLYRSDEDFSEARLTVMSFLTSWLVILAFKIDDAGRVNVLIPYDMLDAENFRRLKVRLKILKATQLTELSANDR